MKLNGYENYKQKTTSLKAVGGQDTGSLGHKGCAFKKVVSPAALK